ncbi:7446_t:CDS:2, partial [Acaulospora morrowiae]
MSLEDGTAIVQSKSANPTPLGLSSFALTLFVLSIHNVGYTEMPTIIIGLTLFYGGLIQLLAGMWEFRANNMFAATAFSSYGGFWLSLIVLLPGASFTNDKDFDYGLGIYLAGWTLFTLLLLLATFRSN